MGTRWAPGISRRPRIPRHAPLGRCSADVGRTRRRASGTRFRPQHGVGGSRAPVPQSASLQVLERRARVEHGRGDRGRPSSAPVCLRTDVPGCSTSGGRSDGTRTARGHQQGASRARARAPAGERRRSGRARSCGRTPTKDRRTRATASNRPGLLTDRPSTRTAPQRHRSAWRDARLPSAPQRAQGSRTARSRSSPPRASGRAPACRGDVPTPTLEQAGGPSPCSRARRAAGRSRSTGPSTANSHPARRRRDDRTARRAT